MAKSNRSLAWSHMTKRLPSESEPDSLGFIECDHCAKRFALRSQTTNLLDHLKRRHRGLVAAELLAEAAEKPKIARVQSLPDMLSVARPYGRDSKVSAFVAVFVLYNWS